MIEINVVPDHLKKKKKSHQGGLGFALPKEALVGLVGGSVFLIILGHVVLQVLISVRYVRHQELKGEWSDILKAKENADVVIGQLRALQNKVKAVQVVTEERKILWAQILNELSDNLPRGVWISKISLMDNTLYIQGSSVSKDNTEILSVHKFTSNLKDDADFKKYFKDIEIAINTTRKINVASIADFSIDAALEK